MSRYAMDKAIRDLILQADARGLLEREPEVFVSRYALSSAEGRAIVDQDYAYLYSAGAHPFLLWGWTGQGSADQREATRETYQAAVAELGYPDYST